MKPAVVVALCCACSSILERTIHPSVSSPNAVGYINVVIRPGYNLISCPLASERDSVVEFFAADYAVAPFPTGLTVFRYRGGVYTATTYNAVADRFEPAEPAEETIQPGEAFWVYNPAQTNLIVTFAGEVLQGTLVNPLEAGFNFVASIVPRSGTLTQLSYPTAPGDIVYKWDAAKQSFQFSIFDDLLDEWVPEEPILQPAEGFIVWKNTATDWFQIFSILQW